jgi:hypothetical protein
MPKGLLPLHHIKAILIVVAFLGEVNPVSFGMFHSTSAAESESGCFVCCGLSEFLLGQRWTLDRESPCPGQQPASRNRVLCDHCL